MFVLPSKTGDPKRIRTADCAVRGRRLDHLTMGPCFFCPSILPQDVSLCKCSGSDSRTRYADNLIDSDNICPLIRRNIWSALVYALECRPHDASARYEFLDPVSAPSGDPSASEKRCIEFRRNAEHRINKTCKEIDVGAYELV